MSRYDWPPTEGLVALVKKHGQAETARRLGVPRSTFREHLVREGVSPEDMEQARRGAPDAVLAEIKELLNA